MSLEPAERRMQKQYEESRGLEEEEEEKNYQESRELLGSRGRKKQRFALNPRRIKFTGS